MATPYFNAAERDAVETGLAALGLFARRLGFAVGTYLPRKVVYDYGRSPGATSIYIGHKTSCPCGACPERYA